MPGAQALQAPFLGLTFANVRLCTSMWSAPHSGHSSLIMIFTLRGLPAESVLHTPAGWVRTRGRKLRAVSCCRPCMLLLSSVGLQAARTPPAQLSTAPGPEPERCSPARGSVHWIWKHWPHAFSSSALKNLLEGAKAAVEK